MKVRDAIKLLAGRGWVLVRTRGSHRQYRHPTHGGLVTIAGKPGDDLSRSGPDRAPQSVRLVISMRW
ncbi:MAG: type II toxin-antitoxin system HicA family toxin [Acidobacteriota bacterium]